MGKFEKLDVLVGISLMVMTIVSSVLFVKCEEDKLVKCKYRIIDSHNHYYHTSSYEELPSNCVSLINENHKKVIICGQYTIERIK